MKHPERGLLGLLDQGMRGVTLENIARIPGLLDALMRSVTPEVGKEIVKEFSPVGDVNAIRSIPGLLEEGRPGAATLAGVSAIPGVGLLGDAVRGLRRFEAPMKAAADAGDTRRATGLLEELQAARDVPIPASTQVCGCTSRCSMACPTVPRRLFQREWRKGS